MDILDDGVTSKRDLDRLLLTVPLHQSICRTTLGRIHDLNLSSEKHMKFSRKFGIPHDQAALDFVDIDTKHDLPLFFDPQAFTVGQDPFSQGCASSIRSFFETVIELIRTRKRPQAESLLDRLKEPNEICLGWSKGKPSGRGIGKLQARELYQRLANSEAARTGMIADLADCELFVEGIGPDKISDITANIIRNHLIEYTQQQCELHGVSNLATIPMSGLWNPAELTWEERYCQIPMVGNDPILLVPKRTVRWTGDLSNHHERYYRHFVLNFLKDENLKNNTSLVQVIKSKKGERSVVYKKTLQKEYPLSKDFLFRFSRDNPKIFQEYKNAYKRTKGIRTGELQENFDTGLFCDTLIRNLKQTPPGTKHADDFHRIMIGVLEFIFYPDLSHPVKEVPIHGGRKRIDIRFDNCATDGFFNWVHAHKKITAIWIMVECKNYTSDPSNPELDQLSGRFGANRGRVGLLVARKFEDRARFVARCRDTAQDDRGFILPLVDDDIVKMLLMLKDGARSEIGRFLSHIFGELA